MTAGYAMRGPPEAIATEVQAFADVGVTHLALWFGTTDPAELVSRAERFGREVVPLVDGASLVAWASPGSPSQG